MYIGLGDYLVMAVMGVLLTAAVAHHGLQKRCETLGEEVSKAKERAAILAARDCMSRMNDGGDPASCMPLVFRAWMRSGQKSSETLFAEGCLSVDAD